jgi:uncharacterized membrane protein
VNINVQTALRMGLLVWVGSLFALLGMQRFFIDPLPSTGATLTVFVVTVAPLLIVMPVALRSGARGPLWMCLVMLLYFLEVIFALGAFITAWILLKVIPSPSEAPR